MLKLLPSLLTVALTLPSVINAGVSSFHELQTKLNPSPLDVLDNLDEFETIWVEVHQKSCGKCLLYLLYVYSCVLWNTTTFVHILCLQTSQSGRNAL